MFRKNELSLVNPAFQKYIDTTCSGTFFQRYGEWYTNHTGKRLPKKKSLKKMVFHSLYSDNNDYTIAKLFFKTQYPEVYRVICYLKQDNYKLLSWLMQTIEADIMLDRVAKRISRERPDLTIYTIHDCIVCPIGNQDYVTAVIKEEWEKAVGLIPSVKCEYWY